ncbi:DUF479 domain-containing protein, partial [Enterococcus faecalis]|nr:DUF479 domain-containing protein [Enterococcus faecalis]
MLVLLVKFVIISQIKFWKEVVSVSEEFEKCVADLKKKYQAIPEEKRQHFAERMQKKNFLRYKKIELIKGELLRLEARRAQLELCERSSE